MVTENKMKMPFATEEEQSDFVRRLRLFRDDLEGYAASAGPYVAIQRCAGDDVLEVRLNQHPVFWNSVLASLQCTALISLARIHDNGKSGYLKAVFKALENCGLVEIRAAGASLSTAIGNHQKFVDQCVKLRNNIFAHTNHHAPVHAVFGFEGITIDMFELYWNDVSAAALAVERAVFGHRYGPALQTGEFVRSGDATRRFLMD